MLMLMGRGMAAYTARPYLGTFRCRPTKIRASPLSQGIEIIHINRETITITITLRVNPHRSLETLCSQQNVDADWIVSQNNQSKSREIQDCLTFNYFGEDTNYFRLDSGLQIVGCGYRMV